MNRNKLKIIVAFFGIYVVWGTTYLAIVFGLKGFPPFMLSGIRFLIAGCMLVAFRLLKGERPVSFSNWKLNAITGFFVLAGGTGMLSWAEQYVSSTEACVIEAAGPFLFIAMDRANRKFYFSAGTVIAGLVTGFLGVLLFVSGTIESTSGAGRMKSAGLVVLAISLVFWVIGSLFAKKRPASHSVAMNTGQQLLSAGGISLTVSAAMGEGDGFTFSQVPEAAWYGLFYLVFFGSIVAYFSYQYLLTVKKPAIVSTHTYVNPVVAMFAGWLLAGETISGMQIVGLCVILAGVFLTNLKNYRISFGSRRRKGRGRTEPFMAYPAGASLFRTGRLTGRKERYKTG